MPGPNFDDPTYLEQVYAALLSFIAGATYPGGIKMKSVQRVAQMPDTVPVGNMPALMLMPGPLHVEQKQIFSVPKFVMTAIAAIFVRADSAVINQQPLPDTVVNYIVWGLVNAFANTNPAYQKETFGGLIYHAWIEGEIIPEIASEQMIVTVPIYILPGPYGGS